MEGFTSVFQGSIPYLELAYDNPAKKPGTPILKFELRVALKSMVFPVLVRWS